MPATAGPALPLLQGIRTGRRGAAVSSGGRFVLQGSDTGKEDPDQDVHLPVPRRAGGLVGFVLGSPCCVLCGCLHMGLDFDF